MTPCPITSGAGGRCALALGHDGLCFPIPAGYVYCRFCDRFARVEEEQHGRSWLFVARCHIGARVDLTPQRPAIDDGSRAVGLRELEHILASSCGHDDCRDSKEMGEACLKRALRVHEMMRAARAAMGSMLCGVSRTQVINGLAAAFRVPRSSVNLLSPDPTRWAYVGVTVGPVADTVREELVYESIPTVDLLAARFRELLPAHVVLRIEQVGPACHHYECAIHPTMAARCPESHKAGHGPPSPAEDGRA